MILARITGTVVSSQKNREFEGHKMLLVQPIDLGGKAIGNSFLAIDVVDAGVGDRVIVLEEGGSARIVLNNDKIPLRSVVLGVVDGIDTEEEDHP